MSRPAPWIHIKGDHVIFSRCGRMYPHSTEDCAGARDEQLLKALGGRDGDIVLPAPEGEVDRKDLQTMLDWPNTPQPFEWPLLDAPAMIGGVIVGKGCSTAQVVAIAKRKYQYQVETSPEEHERRQRAFRETLAKIHQRDDRSPEDRWSEQEALDAEGLADLLDQCVTSMLDSGYRADATVIRGVQLAIGNLRRQGGEV